MSTNDMLSFVGATPHVSSSQWYKSETFYQILLIEPGGTSVPKKNIKTKLTVKTRGDFGSFKLDGGDKKIDSHLPSPGSCLNEDFMKALFKETPKDPNTSDSLESSDYSHQIEFNNFYDVLRTLLHTRKMSQLIARTWHMKLEANKTNSSGKTHWDQFVKGNWESIDSKILDGLIARELFLLASSSEPDDDLSPKDVYSHPPKNETGLLIFPTSKAWQGIALSLLMAGQVYYCCDNNGNFVKESDVDENNKFYHQVSQPILSTGEIVTKYALDVSYGMYKGIIQELDLRSNKFSPAYLATLPYPAIPSEDNLTKKDIKNWAEADDVEGDLPFYKKKNGNYLIGAQYHTPPFPYLPSSCC